MLFGLLEGAFSEEQWLEFRWGIETEYSDDDPRIQGYRCTVLDEFHWGPFGYLIGELTIKTNVHYFTMPELVEDISVTFKSRYDFDLPQRFLDATEPCLIKFSHDGSKRSELLAALRYLYMARYNQPDFMFNPTFSAKGPIPAGRIKTIRFLAL